MVILYKESMLENINKEIRIAKKFGHVIRRIELDKNEFEQFIEEYKKDIVSKMIYEKDNAFKENNLVIYNGVEIVKRDI